MSEEEKINGEFAAEITELVETFAALDRACDKIQQMKRPSGETMCDAAGVKCDASCRVYIKKDRLLNFFQDRVKEASATAIPLESAMIHVEPEKPKENRCPSCGIKAARTGSKYCDYCGEEFG